MSRMTRRTAPGKIPVAGRSPTSVAASHPAAALVTLAADVDTAGQVALAGWARDAELAAGQIRAACGIGAMLGWQAAWFARAWSRGVQTQASMLTTLLDAQSTWWRDGEAMLRAWLRPWVPASTASVAIEPLLEAPADWSPAGLLQRAADGWAAVGACWQDALDHDLRDAGARSSPT